MPQNEREFRCTIKRMFKNCPKPDGWFGCFAHIHREDDGDIKLTGNTTMPLADGLILDVTAREVAENEYIAISMSPVTKTSQGLVSYISSMKSVGRITAKALVDAAELDGSDIIEVIKNGEDSLREFCDSNFISLTDKQIKYLVEGISKADIVTELIQFLPEFGGSKKIIERICTYIREKKITDPIQYIKDNPYCLVNVNGISFKTADNIALRLGTDMFSDERLGRVLEYIFANDSSGNLYINLSDNTEYGRLYKRVQDELRIRYSGYSDFGNRLMSVVDTHEYNICIEKYDQESHLYAKNIYESLLSVSAMIWYTKLNAAQLNPMYDFSIAMQGLHLPSGINANDPTNYYIDYCIREYEADISSKKNIVFSLNAEQKAAIKNAILNRMSVITGGPGRGKTSMVDCLAYCWNKIYKKTNILLLAPTGKAMNKLRNDTNRPTGGKYDTRTIDNVLVTVEHGRQYAHMHRKKYENPFNSERTLVIIDESSMIDIEKAAKLFEAMPDCRFCFVGDADQLPPISPGAFFKELIDSKLAEIPVTYLVTPLRNSGTILDNAEKVNKNDANLVYNVTDMPFYPTTNDDQTALDLILETYNDERIDNPDITQIALLCPVKKGTIGSDNINIQIQNIVCPENDQPKFNRDHRGDTVTVTKGFSIPDTIFGNQDCYTRLRVGDIVMNTKNNNEIESYHYTNDDYWNGTPIPNSKSSGIFNGDCGRIIAYIKPEDPQATGTDKSHSDMVIQMFDGRMVKLDITAGEADNIQLGYSMTVHKAQGCEYDSVIYVSPERLLSFGVSGFLSKNLVYTAFTRAKKKVSVIGSKDSLNLCIKSNIPVKNSNFKERITGAAPSATVRGAMSSMIFGARDAYDRYVEDI